MYKEIYLQINSWRGHIWGGTICPECFSEVWSYAVAGGECWNMKLIAGKSSQAPPHGEWMNAVQCTIHCCIQCTTDRDGSTRCSHHLLHLWIVHILHCTYIVNRHDMFSIFTYTHWMYCILCTYHGHFALDKLYLICYTVHNTMESSGCYWSHSRNPSLQQANTFPTRFTFTPYHGTRNLGTLCALISSGLFRSSSPLEFWFR